MVAAKTVTVILSALSIAAGTYTYIAGYEPQSDVVEHAEIDLDVRDLISLLPSADSGLLGECENCDWDTVYQDDVAQAFDIWENGRNSNKTTAIMRSIAGFSSGAENKESGNGVDTDVAYRDNIYIATMNGYWERKGLDMYTWGYDIIEDTFMSESISNLINMADVGDDFRREVIQKGIVYLNIFPYVIWEMQDAINDCKTGDLTLNYASVHAWDEAVAFYTGSLEGPSQGGSGGLDECEEGNCQLQFMLADKRCKNFGTCTADYDDDPFNGYSAVNRDIFKLFTSGRDQILGAATTLDGCPGVNETMNEISGLMLIPFIQGVQRYLYKTRTRQSAKEAGELFAFASAVLPFIDLVDSEAAEMLFNRAWNLDYDTHSWYQIKLAIESTYPELGLGAGRGVVTCAQVGELTESFEVLSPACVDAVSSDESKSGLATWVTILIVLLSVFLAITCIWGACMRSKYEKVAPLILANANAKDRREL